MTDRNVPELWEWAEYYCPWSYIAAVRLYQIHREYQDRVRRRVRPFPLEAMGGEAAPRAILEQEWWLAALQEPRAAFDLSKGLVAGGLDPITPAASGFDESLLQPRDIDRRHAWQDRIVDALCDPPESFLLSQIVAHVLTFSAHRRQLVRWMLRDAGVDVAHLDPDPIMWHRKHSGGF